MKSGWRRHLCQRHTHGCVCSLAQEEREKKTQAGTIMRINCDGDVTAGREREEDGGRRGHRAEANNDGVEALPVSAVLLRLRTFRMSLVIFLMVCRASSLSLPTPYRTTSRWLHSWLALSSWRPRKDQKKKSQSDKFKMQPRKKQYNIGSSFCSRLQTEG